MDKETRLSQLRTDISIQHYEMNRAKLNIEKLTEEYNTYLLDDRRGMEQGVSRAGGKR